MLLQTAMINSKSLLSITLWKSIIYRFKQRFGLISIFWDVGWP